MSDYQHLMSRVIGRPHLVEPVYAAAFISALGERFGIEQLSTADGRRLDSDQMKRLAAGQGQHGGRPLYQSANGVAVIPIAGTLAHRFGFIDPMSGLCGYDGIQAKLEAALSDPEVRGIALDIDSPGGEVAGCFDLCDQIAAASKPVWAVCDELAASAAYALASAADRVVLPRTGRVGSIGVVVAHMDRSKEMEKKGVAVTLIHGGAKKIDGHSFAPLPDRVRAELQTEVDELRGLFVRTVAKHRGISEKAVADTEAQVYTGQAAVKAGLADQVMPAHEVLGAFSRALKSNTAGRRRRQSSAASIEAAPSIANMATNYWGAQHATTPVQTIETTKRATK